MFSFFQKFRRRAPHLEPDVARMPIPADRLAALRPSDQFIVSYPRSGNTWVRNLMRDVIALEHPELPYPEVVRELIPDIHIPEHPMEHPSVQQFQMPTRVLKSHNVADLGAHRFVYIVRNPADSLVSYYHFHRLQESIRELVNDGIDAFCRTMVSGWVDHVQLALKRQQERPSDVLIVAYEDLISDGQSHLGRIANFLGFKPSTTILSAALERSSFARLRSQEEVSRGASEEYFFRKGRPGTAQEELKPETLEILAAEASETYKRAVGGTTASAPNS